MSNSLPFFKFFTNDWLNGDISFEDYETQGVFISICSMYWARGGKLDKSIINKKYPNNLDNILDLTKLGILVIDEDDLVNIRFLDDQLCKKDRRSSTSAVNGSKGGRPKEPKKPNDNLSEPNDNLKEPNYRQEKTKIRPRQEEDEDNIREDSLDSEKTYFPDSGNPSNSDLKLPDAISLELWNEFIRIKFDGKPKPKFFIQEHLLTELMDYGNEAYDVLMQSVKRGWKTFHPIKEKPFYFPTAKVLTHPQIGEYKFDEATKKVYSMDGSIHTKFEWDHEWDGMVPIL